MSRETMATPVKIYKKKSPDNSFRLTIKSTNKIILVHGIWKYISKHTRTLAHMFLDKVYI